MKERPINLSSEEVRAIWDGKKTQLRRVADVRGADRVLYLEQGKLIPPRRGDPVFTGWVAEVDKLGGREGLHLPLISPFGVPGDRLWVKETWAQNNNQLSDSYADRTFVYKATAEAPALDNGGMVPWSSPIHMPRWACRLTLDVTDIRVQRVQEISEEDAIAEGRGRTWGEGCFHRSFAGAWDAMNARRGFPWKANPWVRAVTFQVRKEGASK